MSQFADNDFAEAKAASSVTLESPCCAMRVPNAVISQWLVDTGCGHDLVDKRESESIHRWKVTAEEPQTFHTAGGPVEATEQMPMFLQDLGATIKPWILDDTPSVLSVGRRCQAEGWAFYWPPWSANPIFVDPQGRKHILEAEGYVPYLRPKLPVIAAAVMQGSGTYGAATGAVCCAMPECAAPGPSSSSGSADAQDAAEQSDGEDIEEYDHRGMCEQDLR